MTEQLKISFLIPNNGIGGGVRSTMRVGNDLINRGHDVRIYFKQKEMGQYERIRAFYLNYKYGNQDWLEKFKGESSPYGDLKSEWFDNDEIVVAMCATTAIDMHNCLGDKGKQLLYCRGAEYHNWENMVKSWNIPAPKIATCQRLAKMIYKETNQTVIDVIPNGIDTNEYYQMGDIDHPERIGIGGYLSWNAVKAPEVMISAMELIGNAISDSKLYLFSAGKRPDIKANIQFKRYPNIDEVRALYNQCKIWLMSSHQEGFGNSILEAMACGCVVISTDCGGPSDIIQDGVNGYLVDIGNFGEMAYKARRVYYDETLRNKIIENSLKTLDEYNWKNIVDKIECILLELHTNDNYPNR